MMFASIARRMFHFLFTSRPANSSRCAQPRLEMLEDRCCPSGVNDFAPVITSNGGGDSALVPTALTFVTRMTATDVDPGSVLTYRIAGGADANRFQIDETTGVLSFLAEQDPLLPTDADLDGYYRVDAEVSDGVHTDTQSLRVAVIDPQAISVLFDADVF